MIYSALLRLVLALLCDSFLQLFILFHLTFAKIDSKNIDCGTTRQNDCTYGSPLKHTNTKIAMSITQARISCAADSSETSQAQMTRVKITFVSTVYIARAACWLLLIVNFGATPCAVRYRREISHSAKKLARQRYCQDGGTAATNISATLVYTG